jgi:hypothetical protein
MGYFLAAGGTIGATVLVMFNFFIIAKKSLNFS